MIRKRFFPTRWARISAWTGAAIAWVTSAVAIGSGAIESAGTEPEQPAAVEPAAPTTTLAAVPVQPEDGLVVLRFTPVPPPPPQVVVQEVVVPGPRGPSVPTPKPPVTSKGS